MSNEMDDYTERLAITLRDSDKGRMELRSVVLGARPLILIEPEIDEDTKQLIYRIDATDLPEVEDLAEMLQMIADAVREGAVTEEGSS